jgi:hypothetical protein
LRKEELEQSGFRYGCEEGYNKPVIAGQKLKEELKDETVKEAFPGKKKGAAVIIGTVIILGEEVLGLYASVDGQF